MSTSAAFNGLAHGTASVVSTPNGSSLSISGTMARARDTEETHARVERVDEVGVAAMPTVACVAMRPTRRLRVVRTAACASGVITPTTGTWSSSWSCGSEAEVAALQAATTSFTPCPSRNRPSLARVAPDLRQRPRPVRQPRVVTEIDEILVRHRHEALVQDCQAAHARVEDADRSRPGPSRDCREASGCSSILAGWPVSASERAASRTRR